MEGQQPVCLLVPRRKGVQKTNVLQFMRTGNMSGNIVCLVNFFYIYKQLHKSLSSLEMKKAIKGCGRWGTGGRKRRKG